MKRMFNNTGTNVLGIIIILFILSFIFETRTYTQKRGHSKPKVNIDVNRHYDENGNVIQYDSSYSYSWSNFGDSIDIDSICKDINRHFNMYNFWGHNFFPDFYTFPELPDFPDLSTEPFFRYNDSSFSWHDRIDSLFRYDFNDDFFHWDISPFYHDDSTYMWHMPFNYHFPHSYFDNIDKYLDRMRRLIEKDFPEFPFYNDTIPGKDIRHWQHNKYGKNSNIIRI